MTAQLWIAEGLASGLASASAFLPPHFSFPQGAVANEQIMLRWIHFVAGILWIGLLYFFNLVGLPAMNALKAPVRAQVFPALMGRAMLWFRWSALVTVLAGLRYFTLVLKADAANAGNPALLWRWLGGWFLVWLVAYVLIYALQMPMKGALDNGWIRAFLIAVVVIAASWIVLEWNAGPQSSNSHLCISVGGGLGLIMLLNVWGIVWRAQKKLIVWNCASAENGTPIPADAAKLARWSFIAARTAFVLSFPMLFFMAAASHFPFLGSGPR
jgi:uncharacterized membrane protein